MSCSPTSPARDRDGELIAVPTEWDEEAHGAPPKIRIRIPRKARPGEVAGVGDRALLRVEETGDDGDADPPHRPRHQDHRSRQAARARHLPRAARTAAGGSSPIDKKQLGRELAIPPGATRRCAGRRPGRGRSAPPRRGFGLPTARVEERLGSLKTERAVSLIAIHAHGIPHVFPPAALAEAEAAQPPPLGRPRGLAQAAARSPSIRPTPRITTTRSMPSRTPIRRIPGGFVIRVAIADVAHYVRPGSALDREALRARQLGLFPRPGRADAAGAHLQRSVLAAAGRGSRRARGAHGDRRRRPQALATRFHRVLIRSAAKLNYQQAQAAIDGWPDDTTGPLLGSVLEPLYAAYRALKRARDERAPLDLDLPERKIVLTAHNTVDRVMTPERLDAHRLIEEFMILANVAAAETLERAQVPLIYRVHDEPDMERVNALREFLKTLDISLPKAGALRAEQFNHILARVKGREVEKLVNEVVLRTQAQAEYAAENYGHFGLNLRRYAHFTSPIRRYADLIVHRGLIRAGKLGDGGLPDSEDAASARRDRGHDLGRRTARHEGRARDLRPAARAFPRRPHRRDLRRPYLRRHPRRPVREARRHRRRRLHSRRAPSAPNISAITRTATP